jgi:LemA protein
MHGNGIAWPDIRIVLTTSLVICLVAALCVFWALGAYKRLLRVRIDMLKALQRLARHWHDQAQALRKELAHLSQSPETDSAWASLGDDALHWRPLGLAAKQLQACVAGVLAKPSHLPAVDDMASMRAAYAVMSEAWQRLHNQSDDLAGPAVPLSLSLQWQQQDLIGQERQREYNTTAQLYNRAVAQFPAICLAWVLRFNSAQTF